MARSEQADQWMAIGVRSGKMGELGFDSDQAIPRQPSECWAENCHVASQIAPMSDEDVAAIGTDKIMWGSDHLHDEGWYPNTLEALQRAFHDTDPATVRRILSENAADVFDFDLDALAPLAAEHGPTSEALATAPALGAGAPVERQTCVVEEPVGR